MNTTMGGHTFASESGFRTGLLIGLGVALVAAAVAALIPALQNDTAADRPATPAAERETAAAEI
jgi:hypothetical protein